MKKTSFPLFCAAWALWADSVMAQTPAPTALPKGGQVVAGQATIGLPTASSTLTIQQGSNRAAIDWASFNIGSQAQVNVLQPSANAVLLNRVLTPEPSQIFGNLTANGQVFLSNPAGVYFAPNASVNVGGLVATTHGISNADFMAGKDAFSRNGATGSVVNDGNITANPGGYIALLAPEVRNGGVVTARLGGTAALAAGERFTLQFDAGTDGIITPRLLTLSFDGVNKVYDGSTSATVITHDNRLAGDSLNIQRDATFADKNVGQGKSVAISALALTGADAGNYSLSGRTATATADITRLDVVTWTGGSTGNWFDPADWAGGAVPDLANVAQVVIPPGVVVDFNSRTVVAPAQAGPVQVDGIGAGGALLISNGDLNVGPGGIKLDTLTQNGGSLDSGGAIDLNTFAQSGGATAVRGDMTVRKDYSQSGGSTNVNGNAQITDTQGGLTLGDLTVNGGLAVQSTGGGITQAQGTSIRIEGPSSFKASEDGKPALVDLGKGGNSFGGAVAVDGVVKSDVPVVDPHIPGQPQTPEPQLPDTEASPPPLVPTTTTIQAGATGKDSAAESKSASANSEGVQVAYVRDAAAALSEVINVTLPPDTATAGSGFHFELPAQIFEGGPSDAVLDIRLQNGDALPEWLTYEPEKRRFVATAVLDRGFPVHIRIRINGREFLVVLSERPKAGD